MTREDCKIVLGDGVSQGNKEIVALTIEEWLVSREVWYKDGYEDKNSQELAKHLNELFPEDGPWFVNGSQDAFDIYSINAMVAVELKSMAVKKQKRNGGFSRNKWVVGNATLYPDTAKVKDVVNKKNVDPNWNDEFLNEYMDVLVVFVERYNEEIVDYKIVDGFWWGLKREDHRSCRRFFKEINNEETYKKILELMINMYPDEPFIKRMHSDCYNHNVSLNLRKLISYSNPLV